MRIGLLTQLLAVVTFGSISRSCRSVVGLNAKPGGALALVVVNVPFSTVLGDTGVIRGNFAHEDHLSLRAISGRSVTSIQVSCDKPIMFG